MAGEVRGMSVRLSVCLSVCRPDDECTVAAMLDLASPHSLTHSLVCFLASCVLRLSHTDGGGCVGAAGVAAAAEV